MRSIWRFDSSFSKNNKWSFKCDRYGVLIPLFQNNNGSFKSIGLEVLLAFFSRIIIGVLNRSVWRFDSSFSKNNNRSFKSIGLEF